MRAGEELPCLTLGKGVPSGSPFSRAIHLQRNAETWPAPRGSRALLQLNSTCDGASSLLASQRQEHDLF